MPQITNLLQKPKYALKGRIATMNAGFQELDNGILYINQGKIVSVQEAGTAPPPGFTGVTVVDTGGTIFPGMIELHNHLPYNILPLWNVPRGNYLNRSKWAGIKEYRRDISGPLNILGRTAGFTEAIVRYVECKSLVGGVTSSQGIALFSNSNIHNFFQGLVRNVEISDPGSNFPRVVTRVGDVAAAYRDRFWERLQGHHQNGEKLILHLSEGIDDKSRAFFENLHFPGNDNRWAINSALICIHCLALKKPDFEILAQHDASMVWSPLSNLLLYGKGANIGDALDTGLKIALGSDWSPSGSKNLLGELKVASLINKTLPANKQLSPEALVAMVTRNPAEMVGRSHLLGSIEPGKMADLLVIKTEAGNACEGLIKATEKDIVLVCIDGIPRYGSKTIMNKFAVVNPESLSVGGRQKVLNLESAEQGQFVDLVNGLSLAEAQLRLSDGLSDLIHLAENIEAAKAANLDDDTGLFDLASVDGQGAKWVIDLDHCNGSIELDTDEASLVDGSIIPLDIVLDSGEDLSKIVVNTIALDPLTVDDDSNFLTQILEQSTNQVDDLPGLYNASDLFPATKTYLRNGPPQVKQYFRGAMPLQDFLSRAEFLSIQDRKTIARHAIRIFSDIYVHLPHKRNLYGVNPVRQLEQLLNALENEIPDVVNQSAAAFHFQMMEIFASVRDLHTRYFLPEPYASRIAFLPFRIEPYFESPTDEEPQYVVTKVVDFLPGKSIAMGAQVVSWNNIPIARLVEQQTRFSFGSNAAARMARSVDALTIRPLASVLPPDETYVTLRFKDADGKSHTESFEWLVAPMSAPFVRELAQSAGDLTLATSMGEDFQTYSIGQVNKMLFTPSIPITAPQPRTYINPEGKKNYVDPATLEDREISIEDVFTARVLVTPEKKAFGYIRLYTFKPENEASVVKELIRVLKTEFKDTEGLIFDVRSNGGGSIRFAEHLLQLFTDKHITPQKAQFVATPYTLRLCQKFSDPNIPTINLEPWLDSIRNLALPTGNDYSLGFPITPVEYCNNIPLADRYKKPSILIFDALSYSATDTFIAGYIDHNIGKILGTAPNSGAGGANNWSYALLNQLLPLVDEALDPLPDQVNFSIAVRRTLRTGDKDGYPLEDLGAAQDDFYKMTLYDVLNKNKTMISRAIEMLLED